METTYNKTYEFGHTPNPYYEPEEFLDLNEFIDSVREYTQIAKHADNENYGDEFVDFLYEYFEDTGEGFGRYIEFDGDIKVINSVIKLATEKGIIKEKEGA
jgi:predicted RNA-binding protein with EMAP domain